MTYLLAGDLGGTNSRLGLYDLERRGDAFVAQSVYRNSDYNGVDELIELFLKEHSTSAEYASLAVAGAPENGCVEMTNLAWTVSEADLEKRFGFSRVLLLNDLAALAAAVPHLKKDERKTIKDGEKRDGEPIGVIAPGTGLGQGYLIAVDDGYVCRGSEGGHSGFAPSDDFEIRLAHWLLEKDGWLSAEQLCAGPGLTAIYNFCRDIMGIQPAKWVEEESAGQKDLAPVIVNAAAAEMPCPLCQKVLERYLRMVGAETANLALKLLARGGVYIGGGVLLHLLEKEISLEPLARAFVKNGKMAKLLNTIPLYLITKKQTNLYGAVYYALDSIFPPDADPADSGR